MPVEDYGRSKLEAEEFVRRSGLASFTILRPGGVYGPGDRDFLKVFREATRAVGFYAAPSTQAFAVVYVCDLIAALLRAADSPIAAGATYFVANRQMTTWNEVYHIIMQVSGRESWLVQLPPWLLRVAGRVTDAVSLLSGQTFFLGSNRVAMASHAHWICDTSRIRTELSWCEEVPLREGLRQTYVAYVGAGLLRERA